MEKEKIFKIIITIYVPTEDAVLKTLSWYKYQLETKNHVVKKYNYEKQRFLKVNKAKIREYEIVARIYKSPTTKKVLFSEMSHYPSRSIERTLKELQRKEIIKTIIRNKEKIFHKNF